MYITAPTCIYRPLRFLLSKDPLTQSQRYSPNSPALLVHGSTLALQISWPTLTQTVHTESAARHGSLGGRRSVSVNSESDYTCKSTSNIHMYMCTFGMEETVKNVTAYSINPIGMRLAGSSESDPSFRIVPTAFARE